MLQAQITPQYINPPQNPQWASGSVKDTTGQRWSVPKGSLNLFQQGQPANITYEQKTTQNGKPYNAVLSVNGQPIGGSMQPAGQAFPTPTGPVPNVDYRPAPQAQDTKSEEMFVMGVVGRAMGSGQFAVNDIGLLAKAATQAWRERNTAPEGQSDPGPGSEYGDGPGEEF